jgi:hypothetical protein
MQHVLDSIQHPGLGRANWFDDLENLIIDFDWRFNRETAERIFEHLLPRFRSVVCIGTPKGVTRVAVLHHHLLAIPREELLDRDYPQAGISTTLDSGAVIEGLQAHEFTLALHGHQHVPGVARVSRGIINGGDAAMPQPDLAILSAGSAGAKNSRLTDVMRDNSYNLLRFANSEVQIEARRFNPGLDGSRYFSTRLIS